MGWLSGWSYRKSITLSRSSGAVTNYQMQLLVGESSGATGENVDCGGHCASDFDDIRFTTSDGTTLLDYYIEIITGTTPNQLATMWIEFDSIGTSDTTFYMYYGNASASSASSGANTFIVFDDFERGSVGDAVGGDWTVSGSVTLQTTPYQGAKCARLFGGTTKPTITIPVTPSNEISISAWCQKGDTTYLWTIGQGNGTKVFYTAWMTDETIEYYNGSHIDTGYNCPVNTYAKMEINNINFTGGTFDIWYNNSKITTSATMLTSSAYSGVVLFQGDSASGRNGSVDCFLVRNWRAVEPAWGSWGSQETAPQFTINMKHHFVPEFIGGN